MWRICQFDGRYMGGGLVSEDTCSNDILPGPDIVDVDILDFQVVRLVQRSDCCGHTAVS
jgi:hypothetical protein